MTITEAFSRCVVASPNAIALSHRGRHWTYRQLDEHSNQLARWLRRRTRLDPAREREPLIPVCLEQGLERVSALLAVLKLGRAFVPIEPDYPAARVRYMLDDIDARVLITESAFRSDVLAALDGRSLELLEIDSDKLEIASEDPGELRVDVGPESLCYVMYTSGSTGQPKGVPIPHRGVTRLVLDTNYVDIRPDDCFAQASNIAFDASTFEIWGALLNGARAALLSKDVLLDSRDLARAILDEGVTIMFLTTALFNQHVANDPEMFAPLRYLLFGGEATSVDAVRRLLSAGRAPQCLLNVYGPTENTTFSTFFPIDAMPELGIPVPIGKAIRGTSCRVVDSELRPVAVGQTGELLVGGLGLAPNYRNQPVTTAERFIATASLGGEPLYRTGDQVRELPSGDLVFVGRVDNQVKIRGFRIELEEIEFALEAHPSLARAVVSVAEDGSGTRRLVAHLLVQAGATTPSVTELRAFVQERLPSFMLPARFVRVETLPLGMTGKVDRKALAAAGGEVLRAEALAEPSCELERWLRRVWAERLRVPEAQIGVEHDFFALGGDSLLAVSIIAEVREQRGVGLRAQELFAAPTIAQLAQVIERACPATAIEIPRVERADDLPLSWSQEQIWLHQERAPDVPIYNEPLDITMAEAICPQHMEEALHVLTVRHEALRARVGMRAGVVRQWIEAPVRVRLPYHDLRHLPPRRAEARALELARRQAIRSFRLDGEPLVRFTLVRLDEHRSRLYLVGHHLVLDGVGIGQVFLPELDIVYRQLEAGDPPSLPPLRFNYRDWLVWQQHERALPERWDLQEAFWRHKLAGLTPLPLPVDHARGVAESFVGARQCLAISQSTTTRLRELARRERSSLFAVLFAAFKVLLFRWTGERNIAIGTVVAGRDFAGLEQHVGNFLNLLILRSEVAPDQSFLDVLTAARATLTEAFAHQDVPFQRVARHARVSTGELPVRVALVLEPQVAETPGAWQLSQLDVHADTSKFDLTFELDERRDRIIGRIEYRCDLFEADTIERLIHTFETLLDSIVEGPQRSVAEPDRLTAADRQVEVRPLCEAPSEARQALATHEAPRNEVERTLHEIWSEVLGIERISVHQDFYELGGESLLALRMIAKATEAGLSLRLRDLFEHRTIASLATWLSRTASDNCILRLRSSGTQRPLFLLHPAGGSALCYRHLSQHLSDEQPVYGLDCIDGYAGNTLRGMAATYVMAIRSVQASGPYLVGGWSLGGILAHEVAAQLEAAGERVELVVQLDSRPITHARQLEYMARMVEDNAALLALLTRHLEQIAGKPIDIGYAELGAIAAAEVEAWFMDQLLARQAFPAALIRGFVRRFIDDFRCSSRMLLALTHARPARVRAPVVLFRATEISTPHEGFLSLEEPAGPGIDLSYGWNMLCPGGVTVEMIPGSHETCVFAPHVAQLARVLGDVLAAARFESDRMLDEEVSAAQ